MNMCIIKHIMTFLAKDFFLTLVDRHLCEMVVPFVSLQLNVFEVSKNDFRVCGLQFDKFL